MQTINFTKLSDVMSEAKQPKRTRKPGAGRKMLYTSKSVAYATSIPVEAKQEVDEFIKSIRLKYKK